MKKRTRVLFGVLLGGLVVLTAVLTVSLIVEKCGQESGICSADWRGGR